MSKKCPICKKIPKYLYIDYTKNQTFPEPISKLKDVIGALAKCPKCNTFYVYCWTYEEEYKGGRADETGCSISRLSPKEAIDWLKLNIHEEPLDKIDEYLNKKIEKEIRYIKKLHKKGKKDEKRKNKCKSCSKELNSNYNYLSKLISWDRTRPKYIARCSHCDQYYYSKTYEEEIDMYTSEKVQSIEKISKRKVSELLKKVLESGYIKDQIIIMNFLIKRKNSKKPITKILNIEKLITFGLSILKKKLHDKRETDFKEFNKMRKEEKRKILDFLKKNRGKK